MIKKELTAELAARASSGDADAFEELYKLKARQILYHTTKNLGNRQDAEDAAQEVVIGMYRNISGLKDPSSFDAWFHRIISNVCNKIMESRYKKDMNKSNIDDFAGELAEEDREFLPYEYAANENLRQKLKGVVDSLPNKRRRCLTMYYYDEMSYQEIAYAMNVGVGTVATNIKAAKEAVAERLNVGANKDIMSLNAATLPVLSSVLREDAVKVISNEAISKFNCSVAETLKGLDFGGNAGHHSFTGAKVAIVAIFATIAITVGTLGYSGANLTPAKSAPAENAPVAVQNAEIKYTGGDYGVDSVNPQTIRLSFDGDVIGDIMWEITEKSDGTPVASGTGVDIDALIQRLTAEKKDNVYTIRFDLMGANKSAVEVTRDFEIDTDGVLINASS